MQTAGLYFVGIRFIQFLIAISIKQSQSKNFVKLKIDQIMNLTYFYSLLLVAAHAFIKIY